MTTSSKARTLPAKPPSEKKREARPGWSGIPTVARYAILLAIIVGVWQAYVSLMDVPELIDGVPGSWEDLVFDNLKGGNGS